MGYGKNKAKSKKYKSSVKDVKDTSCAKKGCPMPMTKLWIDVESSIKKDKEVKEKDVFDFNFKKASKN
jgi:hypothetical protein